MFSREFFKDYIDRVKVVVLHLNHPNRLLCKTSKDKLRGKRDGN